MERLSNIDNQTVNRNQRPRVLITILFFAVIALVGCGDERGTGEHPVIESAKWNAKTSMLDVSGHAHGDGSVVTVSNSLNSNVIGTTLVANQHYWHFKLQDPSVVPCSVTANVKGRTQTIRVDNAPGDCNNTRVLSRARPTPNPNAIKVANPLANIPQGIIVAPARDLTVPPGTSVTFSALAKSPANVGPVSYLWNFAGAAANATTQNPGNIVFNVPGVYAITLTVSNAAGVDPTPEMRTITVTSPVTNAPPGTPGTASTAPIANIDSPVGAQFIQSGDTVFFSGSGFDPNGTVNTTLTYIWDFGGGAPNSTQQTPGPVTFSQPGVFVVSLVVTDSAGNRSLNNPTVTIVVGNQIAANQPPVGVILAPPADMTVPAGTSLFFQGSGVDPDGNIPLSYAWDFGGAAPAATTQSPGMVPFLVPGVYAVTLTITDSAGLPDANPPVRTITVLPAGTVANNDFPDGVISEPPGDVTIAVGDSVPFVGQGSTPNPANMPLTFLWDFGDPSIPQETTESPAAPITFNTPGVYTITYTVTDALGQVDPMPAEVIVTVMDPTAGPGGPGSPGGGVGGPGGTLEGEIATPPGGQIMADVGVPVSFQGDASGGTAPYMYLWNFGDPNIPDSMEQNPTGIVYSAPGEYLVTLTVADSTGAIDPNPSQVLVVVIGDAPIQPDPPPPTAGGVGTGADPGIVNANAPIAMITSPSAPVTITVGSSIDLAAEAADPNGLPLSFFWVIQSVGTSTTQIPGTVTFNTPGIWEIELIVTNASGFSSDTTTTITVLPQ